MKASVISDGEFKTEMFNRLEKLVQRCLEERNFEITAKRLGREELAYCMGCFGCWIKKPGECVINDAMAEVNRNTMTSDVAIYLCPIVFGQFSANLKNAIDRWIPNMLPFFESRPDGSTMHPARYESYPRVILIGYGDDLSEEDARLFTDITKKHRRNVEVLIYGGDDNKTAEVLKSIEFKRVGGQL